LADFLALGSDGHDDGFTLHQNIDRVSQADAV